MGLPPLNGADQDNDTEVSPAVAFTDAICAGTLTPEQLPLMDIVDVEIDKGEVKTMELLLVSHVFVGVGTPEELMVKSFLSVEIKVKKEPGDIITVSVDEEESKYSIWPVTDIL